MKLTKRILTMGLALTMAFGLTACGESNVISYEGQTIEAAPAGTYVLSSKDGLAYPTLAEGQTEDTDHWFLFESQLENIAELGAKDQLIYTNIEERPTSFTFYKFDELGYTVGTSFDVYTETSDAKSPTIITFGTSRNVFSPISSYLDTYVTDKINENVKITKINGIKMKTSMLTSAGYLKGLTKDAMYKFTFYQGTYYKSITVKADSLLLYKSGKYATTSYSEMESNYFIINLPTDMPNGYYYLEGFGIFKYTGNNGGINGDDKVIDDESSTDDSTTATDENSTDTPIE